MKYYSKKHGLYEFVGGRELRHIFICFRFYQEERSKKKKEKKKEEKERNRKYSVTKHYIHLLHSREIIFQSPLSFPSLIPLIPLFLYFFRNTTTMIIS